MAGSKVPRDTTTTPEMRRFLDDLSRQLDTTSTTFSSSSSGIVPASGGGIFNFLRADGSWVAPVGLFKVLTADDIGANTINAQPWFPTAGAVTVAALTTYFMEGLLVMTHGATAHTTALLFGGTATITSLGYWVTSTQSAGGLSVLDDVNFVTLATAVVAAASHTDTEAIFTVKGTIRIDAAGTLIPQFQFSADPTGTVTIQQNSIFKLTPVGSNTVASQGTWA